MYKEGILDKVLRFIKRLIPKRLFSVLAPTYHKLLAITGSIVYGNPSKKLKVIGVTGTKGKSTTVHLTAKVLESAGHNVAAVGSIGFKIKDREWPNLIHMTMPGRWKLQSFLRQAVKAGCTHAVVEVPSEGIAQGRHLGVRFDCAVFTGLHREHIQVHGSYEAYRAAKEVLFQVTSNIHIINADDAESQRFGDYPAKRKIFYGIDSGEMRATDVRADAHGSSFNVYNQEIKMKLGGRFNVYNVLAALSVGAMYGVDLPTAIPVLEKADHVPGRMDWIQTKPFGVIVDHAHTPDSLIAVYETLRQEAGDNRLICVFGSAGGGRDTWKRKEFGRLADKYCDRIFLTNEDSYEEPLEDIIEEIASGVSESGQKKVERVMDREEAINKAVQSAEEGDVVVILGKGSEASIVFAGGKKIPWSDVEKAKEALR